MLHVVGWEVNMSNDRSVRVKVSSGDFERLAKQYREKRDACKLELSRRIGMCNQVVDQSTLDTWWPELRAEIRYYAQLLREVEDSLHSAVTGK
jgi:hypothetical protein